MLFLSLALTEGLPGSLLLGIGGRQPDLLQEQPSNPDAVWLGSGLEIANQGLQTTECFVRALAFFVFKKYLY